IFDPPFLFDIDKGGESLLLACTLNENFASSFKRKKIASLAYHKEIKVQTCYLASLQKRKIT
ncbi:unnamed protein product, partial [Musa textilis]